MEPALRPALPPAVTDLRNRLTRWRSSQTKHCPIPEDLWEEAAHLAQVHGVSRIATALKLGYYGLKERIDGLRSPPDITKRPAFVEVDSRTSLFPPGFMLEVERKDGTRMTLRLSGVPPLDVAALIESFLGIEG